MDFSSLLGLSVSEAYSWLQSLGVTVEMQVSGERGEAAAEARVVRVIQRQEYCLLTVAFPPRLQLDFSSLRD